MALPFLFMPLNKDIGAVFYFLYKEKDYERPPR